MLRARILPIAVLVIAAAAIGWRLGDPGWAPAHAGGAPSYVYDEAIYAVTAHRYAEADPIAFERNPTLAQLQDGHAGEIAPGATFEWVHPPLAMLFMAAGIATVGFSPVGLRIGSALFGVALLFCAWRFFRKLDREIALVALALLATDGMVLVFARTGMTNIYLAFFLLLAMLAAHRYWLASARPGWLYVAGGAFGASLAIKWVGAPLWLVTAALCTLRALAVAPRRRQAVALGHALAALLVLPALVYVASYTLFFVVGHHGARDFVEQQLAMWHYHHHLAHRYFQTSRWWSWPLTIRPVWFYPLWVRPGAAPPEATQRIVLCLGNPLLWWCFVPALAHVGVRFWRRRQPSDGFILLGFLGVWLPWAVIGRYTFMHYLLPAIPFGAAAVAVSAADLARRWPVAGRAAARAYVLACVAAAIYLHPVWTAQPVSAASLAGRHYLWLTAWRYL